MRKTIKRNKSKKGGTRKSGYFSSIRNIFGGKKERNSMKLQKLNCSPKEKGKMNDFSCYSNELFPIKHFFSILYIFCLFSFLYLN